jgi:hypothetical protein
MIDDGGGDIGLDIDVNPEVEVRARVEVIGYIARNVARATKAAPRQVDLIKRGFTEKLLAGVEMIGLSATGEVLSYSQITVDWKRYAVELSRSTADEFTIETKSSVGGQIAPLLDPVIAYIESVAAELAIDYVQVIYTVRPERYDQALSVLGVSPIGEETKARLHQARYSDTIKGRDHHLPELEIVYKHVAV